MTTVEIATLEIPTREIATREALLGRRADTDSGFPEEYVEVPRLGHVRVRGLSRFEAMHAQTLSSKGPAVIERFVVSAGLIEPALSEDDVKHWQRVSVGNELEPVTQAIARLSGFMPGADKQAYKDFEADPGSEFRLPPGGEVGDATESDPSRSEQ